MSSPNKPVSISQGERKVVEHVGNYIIKEKIGQGSFATVFKAQHKVMRKKRYKQKVKYISNKDRIVYQSICSSKVCKKI